MMAKDMISGSHGEDSGNSGIKRLNKSCRKALGNGKRQLAEIPLCLASSMEIQRSIPWLCTTMISGVSGEDSGVRTIRANCSARISSRLLKKTLKSGIE